MKSSLFFHVNKKSKKSRFMKVSGAVSQIETEVLDFDLENNRLKFVSQVDLSKIVTDQEARDKNLLLKLFNRSLSNSKIDRVLK